MTTLNDVEKIREHDPENMYNRIFDLPEQMAEVLKIAQRWRINADDFREIRNIEIVGMGGSAMGGELARTFLSSKLLIPFEICRHYVLPEYVDDETLVLASSYSGNTEETISAVEDALTRKAMVAAISTGGLLGDICDLNQIPMAVVPGGLKPRAALGYLFVPLMVFFEKVGLIKNVTSEIEAVIKGLQTYREAYIEDIPTEQNPAKNVAQRIHGRIPIIYGGPTLTNAVALRFKGQVCENAKTLAFANVFSEFNHNELVGWSHLVEKHKEHLAVVVLRDAEDHPQIRTRMNIVKEMIQNRGVEYIELHSRGSSRLERMFSLIQIADFASYYLAILEEVNPTPTDVIEELKRKLAEKKHPVG